MITLVRQKDEPGSTSLSEFVLDTEQDVALLPTNQRPGLNGFPPCYPGSQAYTADLEHIFLLSPSGEWKKI